ncbi:MAG: A/G-specific adenine glycosylase, partial [Eubacteriales bacterium]|nr:A/G-specific adenine glycosylase [Eubacteriales bacterium]
MIGKNTRQRKDKKKMETKELQFIVTPLLNWYQENARILPWRKNTEAYCIWVSEIMLQQTRVETVIPYYERFMQHFPTIQALAEGSEEELLKLWEGLGYYSRAKNMQKAAKVICEEYQGQFPEDF